jgi:polyhydroxybutyrate depolymerase
MKTKWLTLVAMMVLAVSGLVARASAAEALMPREWKAVGLPRKALLHVPAKAKDEATPVVFAFHGHGGSAQQASRSFGIHTLWPEAIVVYMDGLPTAGMTDPDGKLPGWQKAPGDYEDRDLKFFDAVLETLKRDYKVDSKRIYATGHSNGGQFTYELWATRGEVLAAVAPSAAAPGLLWAERLKPKPAMHLAGEKDELVKITVQRRAMAFVRKVNGCEGEGEPWDKPGWATETLYRSTKGAPFVAVVHPGSHTFPREAPAAIVKFFKEHAQP